MPTGRPRKRGAPPAPQRRPVDGLTPNLISDDPSAPPATTQLVAGIFFYSHSQKGEPGASAPGDSSFSGRATSRPPPPPPRATPPRPPASPSPSPPVPLPP